MALDPVEFAAAMTTYLAANNLSIAMRRGLASAVPATLRQGEAYFATDTGSLYVGNGDGSEEELASDASILLAKLLTVDGATSGLDAQYLAGKASSASSTANTVALRDASGQLTTTYNLKFAATASAATDLNTYNTSAHGGLVAFNVNGSNAPAGSTYGFLECLYFAGTGFDPRGQGAQSVLLQRYTNFDGTGVWVRAYHNDAGTDYWDAWTKVGP